MQTILLLIHLFLALGLVIVILLQRSEGGALGIGGGGGGLMTSRGSANLLTRTTAVLATLFMAMSLLLAILASGERQPASILDQGISAPTREAPGEPAPAEPPATPSVPLAR